MVLPNGAAVLRYGHSPEGLHNPTIIEARWRFTRDALSLEDRTALEAGIRLRRRRSRRLHRLDEIVCIDAVAGVGRRKATDGEILPLGSGRESSIVLQPR